jgi:hypothetical protein
MCTLVKPAINAWTNCSFQAPNFVMLLLFQSFSIKYEFFVAKMLHEFLHASRSNCEVVFVASEKLVLTGHKNGVIIAWNPAIGSVAGTIKAHAASVFALEIYGHRLYSGLQSF